MTQLSWLYCSACIVPRVQWLVAARAPTGGLELLELPDGGGLFRFRCEAHKSWGENGRARVGRTVRMRAGTLAARPCSQETRGRCDGLRRLRAGGTPSCFLTSFSGCGFVDGDTG